MGITQYLKETDESEQIFEEMSGAEIAKELGITRQAASQTIKRALAKVYKAMMKENKTSPFETVANIAIGFGMGEDEADWKKFFKLFPPKIRKEIEEDAKKLMVGRLKEK